MSDTRIKASRPPGAPGVMVGIDLVEVERVAQTVARFGPRFLERVFTPEELQESRRRITWLAGRFAAKEACAKALGTGIGAAVAWRDMQVLRQPSGKPSLRLLGDAAARAAALGVTQLDLSISHTHQYAIAIVVALTASAQAGSRDHASGEAAGHLSP
jgi:holo-[acyl-carrier protein] synthase